MRADQLVGSRCSVLNFLDPQIAAAGITGGLSLLGGLFGSKSKSDSQKETNEMNYKIAQENNATSREIAAENNAMQVAMNRENNQFSSSEAEKAWQRQLDMFNMENEYNDPAAQRARLEAAGFNPFVASSGSLAYGQGASGNGAPSASASSSGISPSMPQLQIPNIQPVPSVIDGMMIQTTDAISKIADAYAKVESGRKSDAETTEIYKLLDAKLRDIVADADQKEAQKEYIDTQNMLDQLKAPYQIHLLTAQVYEARMSGDLNLEKKLTEQWNQDIAKWQSKMNKQQYDQAVELFPIIKANTIKEGRLTDAKIATEGTQQLANRASAQAARASAKAALAMAAKTVAEENGIKINNDYLEDRLEKELSGMDVHQITELMRTFYDTSKYSEGRGFKIGKDGISFDFSDTKSHNTSANGKEGSDYFVNSFIDEIVENNRRSHQQRKNQSRSKK